jgi:hypothetical protein
MTSQATGERLRLVFLPVNVDPTRASDGPWMPGTCMFAGSECEGESRHLTTFGTSPGMTGARGADRLIVGSGSVFA